MTADLIDRIRSICEHSPSPPPITGAHVPRHTLCCHTGRTPADYETALTKAVEQGVVVVGSGYMALGDDADRLRRAIPAVVDRADDPKPFVAAANQRLRDLEGQHE